MLCFACNVPSLLFSSSLSSSFYVCVCVCGLLLISRFIFLARFRTACNFVWLYLRRAQGEREREREEQMEKGRKKTARAQIDLWEHSVQVCVCVCEFCENHVLGVVSFGRTVRAEARLDPNRVTVYGQQQLEQCWIYSTKLTYSLFHLFACVWVCVCRRLYVCVCVCLVHLPCLLLHSTKTLQNAAALWPEAAATNHFRGVDDFLGERERRKHAPFSELRTKQIHHKICCFVVSVSDRRNHRNLTKVTETFVKFR